MTQPTQPEFGPSRPAPAEETAEENSAERPAIRDLQVQPTTQDGREGVAIIDPLGIALGQVFVPDGLLPIVGRFDGTRTIAQIESELTTASDQELPPDLVGDLVRQFDELLFLDTPRFRTALETAAKEFSARATRSSPLAGITPGYPAEPDALRAALDSIVHRPTDELRPVPRGIVAPHIDTARGREGYSMAYSALAECEPADLYVVFGTGHHGPRAPVTGLAMDWETPLGTVATDRAFVTAIHDRIGRAQPMDVLLHRDEHSLEFQILFLQHVLRDHEFRVAGFLTGQLAHTTTKVGSEPHVAALLTAFREVVDEVSAAGRKVCFVAGADLSHIGPFFGDPEPVDEARLERLAAEELPRLAQLERNDPDGFFAAVENDGNPDRVCGNTPMYLTAALAGCAGRLLHYGQAREQDGSQTVSYCGMLFEG